jgi:hypothetical protein
MSAMCGDGLRCPSCNRDARSPDMHADACPDRDSFRWDICSEEGTILVSAPSGGLLLCPTHAAYYPRAPPPAPESHDVPDPFAPRPPP